MKEVGRIWQNISKDELDYFKEKSRKDMERYWKEHERFINEINDLRAKSKPTFAVETIKKPQVASFADNERSNSMPDIFEKDQDFIREP